LILKHGKLLKVDCQLQSTIDDHQLSNRSVDEARDFIDFYLNEMKKQKAENPFTTFTSELKDLKA
jgi:hypothetical protein